MKHGHARTVAVRFTITAMMLSAVVLMASGVAPAVPANLVFNGDFEAPSNTNPPPGWTMWGAQQYKVPADFAIDTTVVHSGKLSLRIHHPADTAGYIVSSPDRAIHPHKDTMLRVSFWARADKPGKSLFGFTAYETINPYVDAPSPGGFPITVGTEWRQFTFTVREGLDFSADRSRYLMLMFKATTDAKLDRTLWIDDVVATEEPDPHPVHLLDATVLALPPLPHRLRPEAELRLTVDADKHVRSATCDAAGISFHRVVGWTGQPYDKLGRYTLPPSLEQAIRDLHLPMTRFYAVGDEPFGLEASLDRVAEICRKTGISPEHTVIELEDQSAKTKIAPDVWARGVRYALEKGYRFRYWEISNEPYSASWNADMGHAFPTSDDYIKHVIAVSAAIRKVQPDAQIGIGIEGTLLRWGNYVLKQTAGSYDFVADHYYCGANVFRTPFDDIALTENYKMLIRVEQINALLHAYNPGRTVYQYDTEWGMSSGGPNGERADYVDRNANLVGTLHRAVRLIYYTREDLLRGASSWQMLSRTGGQGFGVLFSDAPEARSLLYWLYYYFNRHVGTTVLDIDGTAPFTSPADPKLAGPCTPVLATLSADRRTLYLVIANGSWETAHPAAISLRHFDISSVEGVMLSDFRGDHPENNKPLVKRKEDVMHDFPVQVDGERLTCVLPQHAVVFLAVHRR